MTENQIKKYYTQFPWFTKGRMTRSTLNEKDNIIEKDSHIGDIVATDAIPIKSYGSKYNSVHLFIDQKSKDIQTAFQSCALAKAFMILTRGKLMKRDEKWKQLSENAEEQIINTTVTLLAVRKTVK